MNRLNLLERNGLGRDDGSDDRNFQTLAIMVSRRLKEIQTLFNELKSRQRTSGKNGVVAYLSESASTWDLTDTASAGTVVVKLTFTADGTQPFPFVNPYADLYINGTAAGNKLSPVNGRLVLGGTTVILGDFCVLDKSTLTNTSVTSWTISFITNASITFRVKGHVAGTSRGTVTVTRVS